MTPDEIARLRAVAEAATPGPWVQGHFADRRQYERWSDEQKNLAEQQERRIVRSNGIMGPHIARAVNLYYDVADAAHIAAFDPPTVLALLDEVDRLTIFRDQWQAMVFEPDHQKRVEIHANQYHEDECTYKRERDVLHACLAEKDGRIAELIGRSNTLALDALQNSWKARAERDAALAEVERLINLVERNGIRYCLCSRADRMNGRVRPECPHHGNMTAWKQASIAIAENTSLRGVLAAVEACLGELESGRARADTWTRDIVRDVRAALAEGGE